MTAASFPGGRNAREDANENVARTSSTSTLTQSHFDLIEKENDKIDFKIKAKRFVKLFGRHALDATPPSPIMVRDVCRRSA
jgi:hypothetical protein